MTMESGEASERILCFPARVLQPEESGILTDLSLWERIAPNLVPQPRSVVETDPLYKQVVVYVIIRNGELILSYRRARQTQESRLSTLLSIGLGGHVNVQDEAGLFSSAAEPTLLRQAVDRELREEVRIDTEVVRGPRLVGFLNDDSDAVGRVHFGTLWLLEISGPRVQPRPGAGVIEVEFQTAADLHRDKPRMENWSRQVLDWLVTSPWSPSSERAELRGRGPLEVANRPTGACLR